MKRLTIIFAAVLSIFVFAACETNPPTGVGTTTATLNGQGHCTAGVSMWFTYELNQLGVNTGWGNVGPSQYVNCNADTAEVAINPHPVGGLSQNAEYQQRLLVYVYNSASWVHYDSVGTQNGNNFDVVATEEDVAESSSGLVQNDGPVASIEAPSACDWRHKSYWNYYRTQNPPWTSISVGCNSSVNVETSCSLNLYTENGVIQGSSPGGNGFGARCEKRLTGYPYSRGKYSVVDFTLKLNNKKQSWYKTFTNSSKGIDCNRYRDSQNRASMHCTRTGYAPWYSRLLG